LVPDYNLEGLSPRSFEQLIQAISSNVLGPGLVVFGDGPDGGREATFQGRTSYPSVTDQWDGFFVVQAKFRLRKRSSTKEDADWLLKQVKAELRNQLWSKQRRRVLRGQTSGSRVGAPRPIDYYILGTNVVLTPVAESGSKDKVSSLLEQVQTQYGLKGFAVWDYDQIRCYLDQFPNIRQTYSAWITPGDVLAAVLEELKPSAADFKNVLLNYLAKELLDDQFANLRQAGHGKEDPIPLSRVFVDLPVSGEQLFEPPQEQSETGQSQTEFLSLIFRAGASRLAPSEMKTTGTGADRRRHVSTPPPGRFVLLGGPGQGKTTLSQFACQLLRYAILCDCGETFDSKVEDAMDVIRKQCAAKAVRPLTPRRYPIRIDLKELAAVVGTSSPPQTSLILFIAHRLARRTNYSVSVDDLRAWLRGYPWLLILDGLDEVPASSNRDQVMTVINDFLIDAHACDADLLIVGTTRPQGYADEFSRRFYSHLWLTPLSSKRALEYGRLLAGARYPEQDEIRERVCSRLESAISKPATARLMRSPLQVTIMTALVERVGTPPEQRWKLFSEYYRVIYEREMERGTPFSATLRDYREDIDAIHRRVAFLLQCRGEQSGQGIAQLSADEFAKLVDDRLASEGHDEESRRILGLTIRNAATDRLVFLVAVSEGFVGFEIRSLQEFMAAESFFEKVESVIGQNLRAIAKLAYWRNVFLFAAGRCFAERQMLRDSIMAICQELNDDQEDHAARITLAGSQLALDLLEDASARRQPNAARSLARIALRILENPPASIDAKLAA
jgi:hypothetical protein